LRQKFKTNTSKKEIFMSTKTDTKKSTRKSGEGFTAEEQAAMKERARELKAAANKEEGEKAALAAIDTMQEPDRSMAKRIHAIIKDAAPALLAKTWYGMPAYANKDGKIVCFFQTSQKFNTRYSTFGFNDSANLDEGAMWPTAFALKELTATEEARIVELMKKAVS
jgi:uncharacterized protein YdhG (YjbR/CyaY superfamily)